MRRAPVASVLLVALLAAACGGSTPSSDVGSTAAAGGSSVATSAPSSLPPAQSSAPATPKPTTPSKPSSTPPPSPSAPASPDASSATPGDSGSPSPSASASASADAGTAAACSGSAENRAFFANLAATVSWDVYCAVLPKGWFVSAGSYRLANGGKLVISYKGPAGAVLTLSEGAFCADGSGCVPSGSDTGAASFGAMSGTLVTTDAGGFAIVAARGQTPSWLLATSGLDQATTVSYGAALVRVGA